MPRRINALLIDTGIAQDTVGIVGGVEGALNEISSVRETGVYVHFKGGSTAGVVKIETAHDSAFTGTWAVLATLTWAADNAVQFAALMGVYKVLRVRISTAIASGGSVDVYCVANQP